MSTSGRAVPSIDFSSITSASQKSLFELLDKFDGTKTIIWDDQLIGAFEFVANASSLRQHDASRLFRLSDIKPVIFNDIRTDYILFFIRKDYNSAKYLADILHRADRSLLAKTSLVFVPYFCTSIEKFLQHNKVDFDKLNSIEELKIELYVLDSGVISTENEHVYRDYHLNNDHSFAHQIAQALIKLQDSYGQIPKISGQGKAAKLVCDLLLKHKKIHAKPATGTYRPPPQIHQLILIDRRVDLVTPLLTQLTYEGLIDEIFGIRQGTVTLPADRFVEKEEQKDEQPASPPKDKRKIELKSTEDLFVKLRDCHVNAVADLLKLSTRNLQAEYDECNCQQKTITEIGKIVKRLNYLKVARKSQLNHVTIAELVNERTLKPDFIYGLRIEHELLQEDRLNRVIPEIETKLLRQEPPHHVLRLICLQSIINNGLKSKVCDYYKREIVQNYGPKYIAFLLQLEKANILQTYERDIQFSQLKNKLSLVNDDVDECNPKDPSYVYGGFTPISVMVAKILAIPYLNRPLTDHLRLLPEPTITQADQSSATVTNTSSNTQYISYNVSNLTNNAISAASMLLSASGIGGGGSNLLFRRNSTASSQSSNDRARTVLVFFIGGCTFAEMSALRFLSQQEVNNCEFLIGTTKIINGTTFLKSLWPYPDNNTRPS